MNITTEVMSGLYLLQPGRSYRGYMKSNVFLLDKRILIDTGPGGVRSPRHLLKALRDLKVTGLEYILFTHGHPDHTGGAKLVRESFGGKIAIGREESLWFEDSVKPDLYIKNGQELDDGKILCVHSPGHSPGHFCFYFPEKSILFSGDMVPGWGTTVIAPPDGDMRSYIESLQRLAKLPLLMLCPGHGPTMHDPEVKIKEVVRHRMEREGQVYACLEEKRGTIRAILSAIYPEVGSKMKPLARMQIVAHLLKLQKEKRAVKTGRGWKTCVVDSR